MKIAFFIFNEHIGFYTSMCKILLEKNNNEVTVLVRSNDVKNFYRKRTTSLRKFHILNYTLL